VRRRRNKNQRRIKQVRGDSFAGDLLTILVTNEEVDELFVCGSVSLCTRTSAKAKGDG